MNYLLSFLEGIITFISPCLLPLLPMYLSFFTGHNPNVKKSKTILNSSAFVAGFTLIFISLGAFAGTFGRFIIQYNSILNIIFGIIIIFFGLNFMGIFSIPLVNKTMKLNVQTKNTGPLSCFGFGIIFSVGWTPCVGTFLASALMMAASQASSSQGILMLLLYSLGLGIPFIASALIIDKLQSTLDFIKKNYKVINVISGGILVVVGILMATGIMGKLLAFLTPQI